MRVLRFRSSSWLALAPYFLALGLPAAAQAKCAMASPGLAPAAGKVAPNPVLWLFLPAWRANRSGALPQLRAQARGKRVALRVAEGTKSAGLHTYRIEVAMNFAGTLTVELLGDDGVAQHWALEVDPAWRAPASSVRPVTIGHEVSQWTCSHTRTRNLHFAAAAWAYRVVAAPTREALVSGEGKSFVIPRAIEQIWGRDPAQLSAQANLALGDANCLGPTFDWSGGAVFAKVFALLSDGSEQPVNDEPLAIAPP